ncbi:SubName: Full=Uncharacterized protein {ECO:0000313/EMBL:CCA70648.1} [Serendipita indica DSM 11827]|uniref:Uncharacterized protein n=1 Tax=Serendipita indica (strain DSM 11827) TaxID=1109443 RepID=G4TH44_SERID|nr:SubName: Full=Uncharacterized protein {ECO:0000313/EMBL:CCA70648.1} [Serendipita indica DSM 11827]CCA70648.1 hypothetical protein PIIN_04584 [Serendipita indica DSM 11827]
MIIQSDIESELFRVWSLISELSDQLQENRMVTADLRAQADGLKERQGSTFGNWIPFATTTTEVFEEELEKLNSQFQTENQNLSNENKQLSVLVKEYEQTLESVMSKFRIHAHASQEHELALTRQYEQQIIARESNTLTHELEESAKISLGLARISAGLRMALRASAGEDVDGTVADPSLPNASSDTHALERECELVRLERENEELRALLELRDSKDTATLKEEIAQETREAYARRTGGQLDSPFMAHNMDGHRMFAPGGFRGLSRGGKRGGMSNRGKPRMFGTAQGW